MTVCEDLVPLRGKKLFGTRPQNRSLVPFKGSLQNFRRSPLSLSCGSSPRPLAPGYSERLTCCPGVFPFASDQVRDTVSSLFYLPLGTSCKHHITGIVKPDGTVHLYLKNFLAFLDMLSCARLKGKALFSPLSAAYQVWLILSILLIRNPVI